MREKKKLEKSLFLFSPNRTNTDVSDIFYFFCLAAGKGSSEAPGQGGGVRFLLKIPEGGGVWERGWGAGGRGAGGCLRGNWGGGAKYFCSGPKFPP